MPTKEEKLELLRRNIHPYYIHNLGLAEYETVEELLSLCKKLEINRLLAESVLHPPLLPNIYWSLIWHVELPIGWIVPLVPGYLSALSGTAKVCWNCGKPGHLFPSCRVPRSRKFCFGCGGKGFVKRDCVKCSGNSSGCLATGLRVNLIVNR